MTKTKTKKSLLNLIVSLIGIAVSSTFGLYVSFLILTHFGSDYNGLNATVLQIAAMLQVIEAGFSVAISFALYKPIVNNDQDQINAIFAFAKKTFKKVGLFFILIGLIGSLLLPMLINTKITYIEVVLLFIIAILPTAANLFFIMKFNCIFNANQQEYIINSVNIVVQVLTGIIGIVVIRLGGKYLYMRGIQMVVILLGYIVIQKIFKFKYPKVIPIPKHNIQKIKGTSDVLIYKITGALYFSFPIIAIAIFVNTLTASIYGVYMLVLNIIKSFVNAATNAPMHGFGQLIAEGDKNRIYKNYFKYNLLILIMTALFLSVTMTMILPFISIYTGGVTDINYINLPLAILLIAVTFIELIHIPSGIIILAGGFFRAGRNIQIVGITVLIASGIIGILVFGLYGLVTALLLCAFILAICEIAYIHKKLFKGKLKNFVLAFMINTAVFVGLCFAWEFISINVYSVSTFIFWGGIVFCSNLCLLAFINFIFYSREFKELYLQIRNIFKRRNTKSTKQS